MSQAIQAGRRGTLARHCVRSPANARPHSTVFRSTHKSDISVVIGALNWISTIVPPRTDPFSTKPVPRQNLRCHFLEIGLSGARTTIEADNSASPGSAAINGSTFFAEKASARGGDPFCAKPRGWARRLRAGRADAGPAAEPRSASNGRGARPAGGSEKAPAWTLIRADRCCVFYPVGLRACASRRRPAAATALSTARATAGPKRQELPAWHEDRRDA